jgi:hypothetical protein
MEPGRWWVPEEVGRRLQMDDPSCHSCTACKGQGKDRAVPRTQKRRTFGKRHRAKPEGINGIRDRDIKEHLRLGNERTSSRIIRKALVLEIVKRGVEPSVRIEKMNVGTLWMGRPPPKRKKRLHTD